MNNDRGTPNHGLADNDGPGRTGPSQDQPSLGITDGPVSGLPRASVGASGHAASNGAGGAGTEMGTSRARAGTGHDPYGGSHRDRSPRGKQGKGRSWWIELPVLFGFALVLALLIKSFVVQAFYIPSSSMENTLEVGDKVLVNKLVYDFRPIQRGDIVVFNGDGSWNAQPVQTQPPLVRLWDSITGLFGTAPGVHDYIKRVIGIPGDHVACCDAQGRVTVNGAPLNEKSYLYPGNAPSAVPFHITVGPGRLWVMGDHRQVSWDSRGHMSDPGNGTIPESKVVGRAFLIIAPISRWRVLPIPATFEQPKLVGSAAAAGSSGGRQAAPARALPPAAPLELAFAGAAPLTWLERRLRRRLRRRRGGSRPGGSRPGLWATGAVAWRPGGARRSGGSRRLDGSRKREGSRRRDGSRRRG